MLFIWWNIEFVQTKEVAEKSGKNYCVVLPGLLSGMFFFCLVLSEQYIYITA